MNKFLENVKGTIAILVIVLTFGIIYIKEFRESLDTSVIHVIINLVALILGYYFGSMETEKGK